MKRSAKRSAMIFPLVNIEKTMENHHFQWENSLQMAIFNSFLYVYQRVSADICAICDFHPMSSHVMPFIPRLRLKKPILPVDISVHALRNQRKSEEIRGTNGSTAPAPHHGGPRFKKDSGLGDCSKNPHLTAHGCPIWMFLHCILGRVET